MRNGIKLTFTVVALSISMLGGYGCQSLTAPASASFASVKIGGHTVDEVQAEAVKVFESEGYSSTPYSDAIVFEREGSRWEEVAYGSNVGSIKVINRVKAQVIDLGGGVCRLQCRAYVVRGAGSGIEDEIKLPLRKSGYYKDLLNKTVQRLTAVPVMQD